MKNLEQTEKRLNNIQEELNDICATGFLKNPKLIQRYNELIAQIHNAEININQIKMAQMNKKER